MSPSREVEVAADVIVVGGGPGGSTAATMLARKGHRVVLFERARFPRHHVGESLLPASMPVLEELGVLPAVQQAGFLKKWGATMVWGRDPEPWSWYFRETNARYPHAYQVWRPHFDQILLENAARNGVDVREEHQVVEVLFSGDTAIGVRYLDDAGTPRTAHARWVLDASGQQALLGHKLELRRWDPSFQNLAVYGYFEGAELLPEPDTTNIFIESYPAGWFWNIPLHVGWMSVGAVVDAAMGQELLKGNDPETVLAGQIAQAPHTQRMLRDARFVHGPFVVRDWSYVSERLVGDGFVLVGDAACFIDPLFSSGVHLALMAGVLAAAYVTSATQDESMRGPAAEVYRDLYTTQYNHFREMARLFYASNQSIESYFWEARRILGDDERYTPRQSFIRAVAGQPPLGYERAVLEHGDAPEGFTRSVRTAEAEMAARRERLRVLTTSDGGAAVYDARPRLREGARIERKPVLGEGEFRWGYMLTSPDRPEGIECSSAVARIIAMVDGRSSLAEIIERLRPQVPAEQADALERAVLQAAQALYIEGAIEELSTP